MTIKMECVKESLKKDYRAIGRTIGIFILIVAVVAMAGWITYVVVTEVINVAASVVWPQITAVTVFVILEVVVMILSLGCVTTLKPKEAKSENALIGNISKGFAALTAVLFFHMFTSFLDSITGGLPYPDVLVIFLGFQAMNVILTPFALAYARCKDEPPAPSVFKCEV